MGLSPAFLIPIMLYFMPLPRVNTFKPKKKGRRKVTEAEKMKQKKSIPVATEGGKVFLTTFST